MLTPLADRRARREYRPPPRDNNFVMYSHELKGCDELPQRAKYARSAGVLSREKLLPQQASPRVLMGHFIWSKSFTGKK